MSIPEQLDDAIAQLGYLLSEWTGGMSIPEAYAQADERIHFIKILHASRPRLEHSINRLFGPSGPWSDVDRAKRDARLTLESLSAKVSELRFCLAAKLFSTLALLCGSALLAQAPVEPEFASEIG